MPGRYRTPTLVRAALLLVPVAMTVAPAVAAPRPVELTPFIGVRGGANLEASVPAVPPAEAGPSVSFGLGVEVFVRPDGWFEAFIDHQTLSFTSAPSAFGTSRFDFAVDYLQFGGGYEPPEGRVRPFVTAAVGLTRYGASTGELKNTLGASGSLGGGLRVPIGKRLALRFEVRGYATITDAALSVTCGPGCFIEFAGSGWYQLAARAGLSIRL
jgi:hypothetical protein